ncbi:MAG: hypothetical protein SRB1_02607 [Desulfobacteraceae bacterium Eth-SRB1]|nr:MAG: hypothetical protein SRB1_02607 [Desulfobacteraceae bacterium Eth-SRB1]
MLDVSIAYNRYKFLGHEFLTWLWFIMDADQARILKAQGDMLSLEMDNRIVLENSLDNRIENITIKGDDAGLEEAKLSLQKGGVVTELNFSLKIGDHEWKFNIKGESLNISSLKSPETGKIEKKEDVEGAVLEKIYLYEKVVSLIENLYKQFVQIRISNKWNSETVPRIKKWITS